MLYISTFLALLTDLCVHTHIYAIC